MRSSGPNDRDRARLPVSVTTQSRPVFRAASLLDLTQSDTQPGVFQSGSRFIFVQQIIGNQWLGAYTETFIDVFLCLGATRSGSTHKHLIPNDLNMKPGVWRHEQTLAFRSIL